MNAYPSYPQRKILIVCVDGGTFDLIHPWVREGHLPTFQRLMKEGAWGELSAEIPPITVNNILSMVTGKNAGKHGTLHWLKREVETGEWKLVNSEALGNETLWDLLGNSGKSVAVLNLPLTYPPKPIHGIMVTGLLTPLLAEDMTYPPHLKQEIETYLGDRYPILPKEVFAEGREEEYLSSLMESLEIRYRTSRYLMDRYPCDCYFIHFIETDFVQHFFWSHMDENHPRHDPNGPKKFRNAILQVYQQMDSILGDYLRLLDKKDYLMVVSDHGAGPLYAKFYTNNWLMKEGLLKLRRSGLTPLKYLLFRGGLTLQNIHQLAIRLGLSNLQPRVNRTTLFEGLLRRLFLSYHDVDWERTEAFAMGGFGQIYINRKGGRNPEAINVGEEYEFLRKRIISKIEKLEIPRLQRKYPKRIYRREELFHGPFFEILPDLVIMPEEGYLDPGDFEFFSNAIFEPRAPMSGTHKPNGIFLLKGEGVRQGIKLNHVQIYDIAPSVLYLMNAPIPKDFDGKVLIHAFNSPGDHSCLQ
jgi:predicted AlkP superfamily phosphohydrolase/phosphomutase